MLKTEKCKIQHTNFLVNHVTNMNLSLHLTLHLALELECLLANNSFINYVGYYLQINVQQYLHFSIYSAITILFTILLNELRDAAKLSCTIALL